MKGRATFICAILIGAFLAGCAYETPATEPTEPPKRAVLLQIEAAETFDEITNCYSHDPQNSSRKIKYTRLNDEEEAILGEKAFNYVFADDKLNGIYYYNEDYVEGTGGAITYGAHCEDTIAICVISSEEIYIVPYEIVQEIDIVNIPTLEDAEQYRYKAISATAGDETWSQKKAHISLELIRLSDNEDISFSYYENEGAICIYDVLPHQIVNEGATLIPTGREYYLDEEGSLNSAREKYSERVEKRNEIDQHKSSPPKIGMTPSEVKSSAWGYPKKINKDEYAWGTTEQWVYDEGYVYFENGVVSAIQHR